MNFKEDVRIGLSDNPKHISSKYFYDAVGDKIFQAIMKMPEYYPTNSEYEIFSTRTKAMFRALNLENTAFDLVEFGAGDGFKTKILLERLVEMSVNFRYFPIDISADTLHLLTADLNKRFPSLEVIPENMEYFKALDNIHAYSKDPKLILFLGSSIGNFLPNQTVAFLARLHAQLRPGDKLLIGFDLMKNPKTILAAYNDHRGITKAFNMNVLNRINKELGGHFDLDLFDHYPTYDPDTGLAKSYIVSLKNQEVAIDALNETFTFYAGETIHTEISRKYSIAAIESLFSETKFKVIEHFFDCKQYYVNTLAEKV